MPSMRPSFFMPLVLLVLTACSNPPPIHTATAVDLEAVHGGLVCHRQYSNLY